jgi:hypothetical protein
MSSRSSRGKTTTNRAQLIKNYALEKEERKNKLQKALGEIHVLLLMCQNFQAHRCFEEFQTAHTNRMGDMLQRNTIIFGWEKFKPENIAANIEVSKIKNGGIPCLVKMEESKWKSQLKIPAWSPNTCMNSIGNNNY